jgi:poly(A) polymerase
LGDWWTRYQDVSDSERRNMIRDLSNKDEATGAPRKRKRSNNKRKRGPASETSGSAADE